MPTGYTWGVANGEVTSFAEYALTCARNFGATIMLRDEPLSSEIPEFEPSNYHQEQLDKAIKELTEIATDSNAEIEAKWRKECDEQIASAKKGIAERQEQKERYERMLEAAKRFVPPTEGHREYAKFLREQLEESIRFDCGTGFYEDRLTVPSFSEWRTERIADLEHSIQYHKDGWEEEVARVKQRNDWVNALRKAVEAVEPLTAAMRSETNSKGTE